MVDCLMERLHKPERPHWSEGIAWPADRWDPMSNAPSAGYPILNVRVRDAAGRIFEPVHYACGGGEEQPAFDGWFCKSPSGSGFYEVTAFEWQPLHAGQQKGSAP